MLKLIVGVFIEYYLEERYSIPLSEGMKFKGSIGLSMDNTSQGPTGNSSSNLPLNDHVVPLGSDDKVVLEKHDLSITEGFITNVQTKLYRGVSNIVGTEGITSKGISFAEAIHSVNSNHPDNTISYAISYTDEQKIKLLLKEKGIYRGKEPYDKVPLNSIRATSSKLDHKNITALSD